MKVYVFFLRLLGAQMFAEMTHALSCRFMQPTSLNSSSVPSSREVSRGSPRDTLPRWMPRTGA